MKIINIVLYVVFMVTISVSVLELMLRYIYTPDALMVRMSVNESTYERLKRQKRSPAFDKTNYHFYPGLQRRIKHTEYEYTVTYDRHGWRNPCYSPIDLKDVDLYVIGDSFIDGVGIEDDQTFNCLLNKYGNKAYYTMGLPGANPTQYIQIYEKNIKPNLLDNQNVLFAIFLGNDFENLLYLTDVNDDGKGESFKQSIFSVANNILHKSGIYRLSYLINAVKMSIYKFYNPNHSEVYFQTNSGSTFYKDLNFDDVVVDLIKSLKYLMGNTINDVDRVSLLLIPDVGEISIEMYKRFADLSGFSAEEADVTFKRRALNEACLKVGISCLDPGATLSGEMYYEIDNHLRNTGVERLVWMLIERYE